MKISNTVIPYYNARMNITQRLIGQRQKFATVYPALCRRKPDVMSNVTCDVKRRSYS